MPIDFFISLEFQKGTVWDACCSSLSFWPWSRLSRLCRVCAILDRAAACQYNSSLAQGRFFSWALRLLLSVTVSLCFWFLRRLGIGVAWFAITAVSLAHAKRQAYLGPRTAPPTSIWPVGSAHLFLASSSLSFLSLPMNWFWSSPPLQLHIQPASPCAIQWSWAIYKPGTWANYWDESP